MSEQAPPATTAIPEQDAAPSQDNGCDRGEDKRNSDLCAQWKAADAAFDAARAAQTQTLIGYIGLVLGAVTMLAAIAAAMFAKRAAVATEETVGIARDASKGAGEALAIAARNADAAAAQVTVASNTARHQLRAYISIAEASYSFEHMAAPPIVLLKMINSGQTPAFGFTVSVEVRLDHPDGDFTPRELLTSYAGTIVGPGQPMAVKIGNDDFVGSDSKTLDSANGLFYVEGIARWEDIFGTYRELRFAMRSREGTYDGVLEPCLGSYERIADDD